MAERERSPARIGSGDLARWPLLRRRREWGCSPVIPAGQAATPGDCCAGRSPDPVPRPHPRAPLGPGGPGRFQPRRRARLVSGSTPAAGWPAAPPGFRAGWRGCRPPSRPGPSRRPARRSPGPWTRCRRDQPLRVRRAVEGRRAPAGRPRVHARPGADRAGRGLVGQPRPGGPRPQRVYPGGRPRRARGACRGPRLPRAGRPRRARARERGRGVRLPAPPQLPGQRHHRRLPRPWRARDRHQRGEHGRGRRRRRADRARRAAARAARFTARAHAAGCLAVYREALRGDRRKTA